jgi:hypothetical protein
MPAPYAPADLVVAPISLFVDGDIVQEATTNPGVKAIADRGEGLRLSMAYAADDNLFAPSRGIGAGIRRLARVTSFAALSFIAMTAANNREIRVVDGIGTYQYIEGSAAVADGYKIVTSATGRWFLQDVNRLYQSVSLTSSVDLFANLPIGSISAGLGNTYIDASGIVTILDVAPGDIIEAELTAHGTLTGPGGSKGYAGLTIRPVGEVEPNTIVDSQHFLIVNGTSLKRISLQGRRVSASALGSWQIGPRIAYSAAPPTIFTMLDPFSLKIRHYKP